MKQSELRPIGAKQLASHPLGLYRHNVQRDMPSLIAMMCAAQPIEHLASFRAMPNILMLRPGDGTETAGAYKVPHLRSVEAKGGLRMHVTQLQVVA